MDAGAPRRRSTGIDAVPRRCRGGISIGSKRAMGSGAGVARKARIAAEPHMPVCATSTADIITVRQAARVEATGRVRARAIAIDTMQNKNPRSSAGVLV
ncbi:hypothetical protein J7430_00285 [Xanthomonas axonopodis pv. begoniae]|nr:hypothetical protein [Xanthomonas axonopodis pv. begoniae]